MTTRPDHHEPLDAEERDLAARLGRAAPVDGPSPALDARILAAAHAAAATHKPRRHRRLAWIGVPPALVTGVGVAAAAVLALGLVWQLRPQSGGVMTRSETGTGDEMIIMVDPPAAARAPSVPPSPPEPAASTGSTLPAEEGTAPIADRAAPKAPAEVDAAVPAPAPAPAPPAVAGEAGTLAAQGMPEEKEPLEAASDNSVSAPGFAAAPPGAPPASPSRKSHATYTTAARATAERRERASNAVAAPAAAAPEAAASQAESTTLDRVEVTGSRIRDADVDWSQVPVSDDTRLAAAEWLERIRARGEGGDIDNARASLKQFRREYPRVRIPDDLRALLIADAPR